MRLKRLDIAGFKSFVDPTRIDIDPGMTAIVGPNGCGKSNIVDAIRWVLGEHSARQLRGGVMEDLIFQGSDTRAPVSICDVELTFAVHKGQLSPPYHDMEEIRIRRRLVRDVGSDAYINGKPVRLKDIVDIFLDTGVSTRAYAIVEQGSIARMITAKPEERRQLLEEAAGVMKYRARRKEAEQKMKSTQQNMERVLDLLEEVRRQCQSLKQQASRAERFKALQDEHEQLRHQTLALRLLHQQQHLASLQKDWDAANHVVEEKLAVHQQLSLKVAQLRRSLVAHEDEVQQAQDELRQRDQQLAELQRQAERLSGERRLLEERQHMLEQRMEEHEARIQLLEADIQALAEQLSEQQSDALQATCQQHALEVEAAAEHVEEARERYNTALRQCEQLKAQQQTYQQQQQHIEKNLSRLQQQKTQLLARQEAWKSKQAQHQQVLFDQQSEMQRVEQALQDAQHMLETVDDELQHSEVQQQQAKQERDACEHRLRQLKGEQKELQAQLAQQPMSAEVRACLQQRGALWMDEVMPLVPEGLELAVAAALRGHEGDALLDSRATLQACYAQRQQWQDVGVALFVQTSGASSAQRSLANLLALEESHPLYGLMAQTHLCEDIQQAEVPEQGCVVSRDGWCLTAEGWLLPPAKAQTARRLQVQRRLQQLEDEVVAAELALEEAESHLQEVAQRHAVQQQQQQQLKQDIQGFRHQLQSIEAALQRAQDELDSQTQREAQWQRDMQIVLDDEAHWQQEKQGLVKHDDGVLAQAQQHLEQCQASQQQYDQQWQQARSALAHAEQALALHRQTRTSLERDKQRAERELAQLKQRLQSDRQQWHENQKKQEQQDEHAMLDMQLLAAQEAADFAHQSMQQLRQQGSALQEQLRMQERQEQAANQAVQDAGQARQKIEMAQATETARLQDMQLEMEQVGVNLEHALDEDWHSLDLPAMLTQCADLEQRLARFGAVNLLAIEEFQEASEREQFLSQQLADLEASIETLQDTIVRIDRTTRQRFRDVFEQTNAHFQSIFPKLFGGGRAELRLDSDDVLTAGVEVSAQPPGKRLQDMRLLSGGEKALTAVALVFSIFKINPAPFCILDEVDAPLDDANVVRFSDMIMDFSSEVQFLAITHNKITMKKANRLIGVSMPEAGISNIVSVDLEAIPDS